MTHVTRQRRGSDFNPGPSAPESSMLTTRLPSQPPLGLLSELIKLAAMHVPLCPADSQDAGVDPAAESSPAARCISSSAIIVRVLPRPMSSAEHTHTHTVGHHCCPLLTQLEYMSYQSHVSSSQMDIRLCCRTSAFPWCYMCGCLFSMTLY